MGKTLHNWIEKTCVSSVFHAKADSSFTKDIDTLHQCIYIFYFFILNFAFEVLFKFLSFCSFLFKLSASFRWNGTGLISIGLFHFKSTSEEIIVRSKWKWLHASFMSGLAKRCWSSTAISVFVSVFSHVITIYEFLNKNIWIF